MNANWWYFVSIVHFYSLKFTICQRFLSNYYVDELQNGSTNGCVFPEEIQGTYKTQDFTYTPNVNDFGLRDALKYKDIFIGPTSIPYWGDCFEKVSRNSYVLGLKKVGGSMCYRCFVVIERTPNVLQAQTINETNCYRTIDDARRTCLESNLILPGEGIILWRTENIQYQYCPVGGRANLTYNLGNRLHCPYPTAQPSTISNCQLGYQLDISFRSCTFPAYEMSMKCLGTWDAGKGDGETYFAIYNTAVDEYRCGIYKDDRDKAGYATAALSNDSSCTNMLVNNSYGYEVFAFFSEPQNQDWLNFQAQCTFPDWLRTDWEIMTVGKELISYYQRNDPNTMMTLYGKCATVEGDYVKVFTKTHCGDTLGYHCLWFNRHSATMTELRLGLATFKDNTPMSCNKEIIYSNSSWTALTVREVNNAFVPCSHLGFYTTVKGLDKPGRHCYNLTVDCHESNRLLYTSYICGTDNVFESHQYRCLSSWTEGDYYFTYTLREDTLDRGCFVSKFRSNKELFMVWTERNCERNLQFETLLLDNDDIDKPILLLENNYDCLDKNGFHTDNKHPKTPDVVGSDGNHNSKSKIFISHVLLLIALFCVL